MGGANNICSDKTGTLTKNEMNVTKLWSGNSYDVDHNSPNVDINLYYKQKKNQELLFQGIACNTIGTIEQSSATEKSMMKML